MNLDYVTTAKDTHKASFSHTSGHTQTWSNYAGYTARWLRHDIVTFSALLALWKGNHRWPIYFLHKGLVKRGLLVFLVPVLTNFCKNTHVVGDLRGHDAHVTSLEWKLLSPPTASPSVLTLYFGRILNWAAFPSWSSKCIWNEMFVNNIYNKDSNPWSGSFSKFWKEERLDAIRIWICTLPSSAIVSRWFWWGHFPKCKMESQYSIAFFHNTKCFIIDPLRLTRHSRKYWGIRQRRHLWPLRSIFYIYWAMFENLSQLHTSVSWGMKYVNRCWPCSLTHICIISLQKVYLDVAYVLI